MNIVESDILVNKAIENAPAWLIEDLENIVNKEKTVKLRISYVISELYSKYAFSYRHIFSSMGQSSEWAVIARERLNLIDNNIDLIEYMMKRIQE
ncbi:hypothetical protein BABA_18077 [Neobacillus bataviensis LMG 21833]|uniref:Uncharacterized protein n=1 Tax=Neobacillus bataviensis LMG 21833 TaxID=1117379 RepID=K6C463_9BACI|nr:hypothetical protein [Neobacillus bataviensis]EKN65930.1 hypothetical protein BABA_18077 [Neobacillus bataviensis LMG 21833]